MADINSEIVSTRHVVQIASLLKKPFLESPEDVEEFLTRLRTELTNALARGERIHLT